MALPTIDIFAAKLRDAGIKVEENLQGSQFTTYKIGGPISYCVRLKNDHDLHSLAEILLNGFSGVLNARNVCIIGNGSNLLIDDDGFNGFIFVLEGELSQINKIENTAMDQIKVCVGAGMSLPMFARQIVKDEIGGLEFYVGIPGTVGGALAMNAGGHGKQTSDVLESVKVLNLTNGSWHEYTNPQCDFEYRSSRFSKTDLIIQATFIGNKASQDEIKKALDEIVSWRRENQPGGRNVGSVFQNPEGISAGALIEKCGLKGFSIRGASISEKHANFIQADSDAKAVDVKEVIAHVQKTVFESLGYELKTEVRYISNYE